MPRHTKFAGLAAFLFSVGSASAVAEPAMWTLADEDTTINIIGTVHYLPEDVDWRTGRIGEAFDAADTVCFELDAENRAAETVAMMFNEGLFRDGEQLVDHLNNRQIKELRETAHFLGIPFASLNMMKPWFASLTMDEYVVDRLDLGDGVEFTLYPEIAATGKELCELETPQEQLGEWIGMSLRDQVEVLFLEYPGAEDLNPEEALEFGEQQLAELIGEWVEGDVAALDELINTEASLSEPFHNALLVSRNENWIPRIEALLEQEGNILIAVGAAHLAGDDSVIRMLRARGHKIDGP